MPISNDISCNIRVDGNALQEYNDHGDDQSSQSPVIKTVYVEAQESTNFSISCEILPSYEPTAGNFVSFRVSIDGKEYCRKSISVEKRKVLELQGSYGVDRGIVFVHPFQFAGVSLGSILHPLLWSHENSAKRFAVEDHESDIRIDPQLLETVGEVSVCAIRTVKTSTQRVHSCRTSSSLRTRTAIKMASMEKVNEKALKGKDLTHVTRCVPIPNRGICAVSEKFPQETDLCWT